MNVNLNSYGAIKSILTVKIACNFYKASPGDAFTYKELLFNDSNDTVITRTVTLIDGVYYDVAPRVVYPGLGRLLNISNTVSELRSSMNELTMTISGIPNTSIYELINSRLKGSTVTISRILLDPSDGYSAILAVDNNGTYGNTTYRYKGIINNFTLTETFDYDGRSSSNTINIVCTSQIGMLSKSVKGRRTNPVDQELFFPGDTGFKRVPNLVGSYFNFGGATP
jgi:hypothetical protein